MRYSLEPFASLHGEPILTWVESAADRDAWASDPALELTTELFARWHADATVHPYVLLEDGALRAYGEIWTDDADDEAELAHVVVAPAHRGRGVGGHLVALLVARAHELGLEAIWVRVLPENAAALACYKRAGFVAASNEEETAFNAGQPRRYAWLRYDPSDKRS